MKLFFLRHTSLDVESDTFYGQTDLDVSEKFESELTLIKKKIVLLGIDKKKIKFYSSPLQRCLKLAKSLSQNIAVDPRLKEINLGDWEMKRFSEISKKEKTLWEENFLSYKIPNGETNNDFLSRLSSFTNDIISENLDVFVVAHAGSINGMISNLTKRPFDKQVKKFWEKISYGSISMIERINNKNYLRYIGK
mgnify:FL=1